jgi:hypothetical protein
MLCHLLPGSSDPAGPVGNLQIAAFQALLKSRRFLTATDLPKNEVKKEWTRTGDCRTRTIATIDSAQYSKSGS